MIVDPQSYVLCPMWIIMFIKMEMVYQAFTALWPCIGGLFKGLFRMAVPLIKRGFVIAKAHLKTVAEGIVGEVVSSIVSVALWLEMSKQMKNAASADIKKRLQSQNITQDGDGKGSASPEPQQLAQDIAYIFTTLQKFSTDLIFGVPQYWW